MLMMRPFQSISTRLIGGFAGLLMVLVVVAVLGDVSARQVAREMEGVTGINADKTRLANEMLASVSALGIASRSVVMLDAVDQARAVLQSQWFVGALAAYRQQESELVGLLERHPADPEESRLLAEIVDISQRTGPQFEEAIQQALDGDPVSANMTLMVRVNPGERAWSDTLSRFVNLQYERNAMATASVRAIQSRSRLLGITFVVIALWVGALVAWRTVTSVVQPVGRAMRVTERIASGDLTSRIDVRSHDETGRLLDAVSVMQSKLRALVGQIQQGVTQIESSTSEVAGATTDLSNRTEMAAHHLQEASSALSDLNQSVEDSTTSAQEAHRLVGSASDTAARSGTVIQHVMNRMEDIRASAHRIADIIGVIDGIAFQTNILALNAAVEAARAGEQGRGFAVVADEVRTLAQRSAHAAKEIKGLILSSGQHVSAGNTLVSEAGAIISELVRAVQEVSAIVSQMAQTTAEQSQRIGRVVQVVATLDATMQQNAAMVEQSAAATQNVREQATALANQVGSFRL